jgi:hypothetical protein
MRKVKRRFLLELLAWERAGLCKEGVFGGVTDARISEMLLRRRRGAEVGGLSKL